jgi:antitoxin component of MazEF toxin-antitoxin module
MIKKMVSHGNSSALIIDKPILEILKISEDTPLEVSTDGKNLIISPVRDTKRGTRFRTALRKVNDKHGKTLRRLSG